MDTFDHLLNWKLKAGSHPFPGPDGGTCINEAALVAAGFDYTAIHVVDQMPQCFSRPICRLVMLLNDLASDEDRQRLLPYVMRLACADTKKVEKARNAYIRRHIGSYYVGAHLSGVFVLSFGKGLKVLEGALAMGRQADLLGPDEVQSQMVIAQSGRVKLSRPATSASVSDQSIVLKLKTWFKEKAEPAA